MQLLLNLQLQARTIIDLKNMIGKQQKFIEDNDIGATAQGDSKYNRFLILSSYGLTSFFVVLDIKIFLGDDEEDDDQDD